MKNLTVVELKQMCRDKGITGYSKLNKVTGETRDVPFFFTTDPNGGSRTGDVFNIAPTSNGTIRFTASRDVPSKFYYQSTRDKNVGGLVLVN